MQPLSSHTRRWTAAVFTGLLVVGLATFGEAQASEVVDGNPTCGDHDFGAKVEDPSGTLVIDRDGLHLTMTVGTFPDVADPNPDNAVLSYVVHPDSQVTSGQIIVKGGSGAIVYQFGESPPLHSPTLENGKWPTISHVQVCWDQPEQPEHGRIELTKVVTGDDAPDGDFELCITGPAPATTQQCQTVAAGDTATFDDLEPGAYTVTETDPGTDWTVTYSDTTLTVTADATATATVTNDWETQEQLPPTTTTPPTVAPGGGSLPPTGQRGELTALQSGIAAALLTLGGFLLRTSRRSGRTAS